MGRKRVHEVSLKEGEREELESFIRKGKASARSLTRARILLLADEGMSDKEIVDVLNVCRPATGTKCDPRNCTMGVPQR